VPFLVQVVLKFFFFLMFGCQESGGKSFFFFCCLGLIFQSIFFLWFSTLLTITVTDLAVMVGCGTNHCRKEVGESFSFSDFIDCLAEATNFCRNRPMLSPNRKS
jgi:hypothetical protein